MKNGDFKMQISNCKVQIVKGIQWTHTVDRDRRREFQIPEFRSNQNILTSVICNLQSDFRLLTYLHALTVKLRITIDKSGRHLRGGALT
jgi:hypothetical protein